VVKDNGDDDPRNVSRKLEEEARLREGTVRTHLEDVKRSSGKSSRTDGVGVHEAVTSVSRNPLENEVSTSYVPPDNGQSRFVNTTFGIGGRAAYTALGVGVALFFLKFGYDVDIFNLHKKQGVYSQSQDVNERGSSDISDRLSVGSSGIQTRDNGEGSPGDTNDLGGLAGNIPLPGDGAIPVGGSSGIQTRDYNDGSPGSSNNLGGVDDDADSNAPMTCDDGRTLEVACAGPVEKIVLRTRIAYRNNGTCADSGYRTGEKSDELISTLCADDLNIPPVPVGAGDGTQVSRTVVVTSNEGSGKSPVTSVGAGSNGKDAYKSCRNASYWHSQSIDETLSQKDQSIAHGKAKGWIAHILATGDKNLREQTIADGFLKDNGSPDIWAYLKNHWKENDFFDLDLGGKTPAGALSAGCSGYRSFLNGGNQKLNSKLDTLMSDAGQYITANNGAGMGKYRLKRGGLL
jgi:hypothetical protein